MNHRLLVALAAVVCLVSSCSRPKPIVVGSKDSVEQSILAEIIAQHLEHRVKTEVRRRTGLGDTGTVHQALLNGEIGLYPEYSGLVITELLRESPSQDPSVVMERARQELKRISLLEYIAPLGFDARTVLVARTADAKDFDTITKAAESGTRWKIGLPYEFQNRETGLPSLRAYSLEMGAPLRSMGPGELFKALKDTTVSLIVTTASDANLSHGDWKILNDDKDAFPPMEAALVVRDDVLAAEPDLRKALNELTGKLSLDTMRKLNAQVVIEERGIPDVAGDFLKSAGLN